MLEIVVRSFSVYRSCLSIAIRLVLVNLLSSMLLLVNFLDLLLLQDGVMTMSSFNFYFHVEGDISESLS